ncbi:FtsX-like permease family protein [Nocardia farcinica]|uniref:FtsX-like permease family protein n=1 Tax=Nocardia farcinica TaxID=37329 RepID=UPI0027DA1A58|nr:FtsX-like permease family protein [Nocardia farcinica]
MRTLIDRWRLFSLRESAVHPGRTLASVAVMTVSAAFLVAVFGIFGSLTGSVHRLVDGLAGAATLEVSGITDSGFPATVRAETAAVPGVAAAVPMVRSVVPTSAGQTLVLGTDAGATALASVLQPAVESQLGALVSVPDGVLAGPGLGLATGERLRIGDRSVTVAGVLTGGELGRLNEGHYVLTSLAVAQRALGRADRLDSVLIVTEPGADESAVRAGVEQVVAGRAVVAEPTLRAVRTGNGLRILQYMTLMGAALAFIVAAFLIYTAMSMAIAQRRHTLSMLRAIGGRRRTLAADLLAEAAVIGLLGGAAGAVLGILYGRTAIDALPVALVQSVEARTAYSLPLYAIPLALAASVITGVAAAAVAAHQVYKVSPVEALAPVGVSVADRVPGWMRLAAATVAVGAIAIAVTLVGLRLGELVWSGLALSLFFGAGLFACWAVTGTLVDAAAVVARRCGAAGELAAATLRRAPRRVWATMMTVFIAVAVTVTITGANRDMLTAVRDSIGEVDRVDLWVAARPADQMPTDPTLPPDTASRVAALPGVEQVVEGQLAYATLGTERIILYGLAPGSVSPLYADLDPRAQAEIVAGRGIALSRDLARTLGVAQGDSLTVRTPTGERRLPVVAVVSYFSALTGNAAIGLEQMRAWFDRPGATVLQIDAAPGVHPAVLAQAVRSVVPPDGHVFTGAQSLAGVDSAIRQGAAVSNAVWMIVVLIAAVALLNTLGLSVLERRRELGVLRAMGSTRRMVLGTVLAEAIGIGVVGGGLGLGFGALSQFFFDRITPDIMNLEVAYRPGPMVLGFALGAIGLSLLGSLPPAVRAARLNIIEAIGTE